MTNLNQPEVEKKIFAFISTKRSVKLKNFQIFGAVTKINKFVNEFAQYYWSLIMQQQIQKF